MLAYSLPQLPESSTIDMLIRNGCYFNLLEPRKLDVADGLFLFNLKLGWILGGQTENSTTEQSTESYILAGTIGTAVVDDKVNVHDLNTTDLLSASKPNSELFGILKPLVLWIYWGCLTTDKP